MVRKLGDIRGKPTSIVNLITKEQFFYDSNGDAETTISIARLIKKRPEFPNDDEFVYDEMKIAQWLIEGLRPTTIRYEDKNLIVFHSFNLKQIRFKLDRKYL